MRKANAVLIYENIAISILGRKYSISGRTTIVTEDSFIEIAEALSLFICMIICALYAKKSHLKIGHSFWTASALVFFSAVRRELSFLPDLYVPEDFTFLNKSYDWWEDAVLMVVGLIALAYLIHGGRYLWAVLKDVSKFTYIATISLVIFQYLGEHGIGFGHDLGVLVEEVSEGIIYLIALIYLIRFPLTPFEYSLKQKLPSATRTHSAAPK